MQALIEWLRQNFYAIWPVARVYAWQRALRVRGGRIVEEIGPGLHLRCPFWEEIFTCATTERAVELPTGELTTTDGVTVRISANVAYRITVILRMYEALTDPENTIKANTHGKLMSACAGRVWADLVTGRAEIELAVQRAIQEMAEPWGVEIVRVNLTDMAQPRQFVFKGDATPSAAVAAGIIADGPGKPS